MFSLKQNIYKEVLALFIMTETEKNKIKINFKAGNYEIIESITELKNYDNVVSMVYLN